MTEQEVSAMGAMDLGRAMLGMGLASDAAAAFALALRGGTASPEERLEAAAGIIQCGGDYHTAYDALLDLYSHTEGDKDRGQVLSDAAGGTKDAGQLLSGAELSSAALSDAALSILTEAFYLPNEPELWDRYQANCSLLADYPYLFRRDFPAFGDLPLRFFPYDDGVYCPFDGTRFLPRTEPGYEVISRNFFRDLEQPVLASDVFSQYELAYLRDNVRRSEDVGRENHVYLHYTDWPVFCAWLQVLDFSPLLREEKLVFLFGDEIAQYPLDFQARFGIDYSRFPLKPVGVREVTRLIWHTQLSSHNGGDFFNEIFDAHPNLVCLPTLMLSEVQEAVDLVRTLLKQADSPAMARYLFRRWDDPSLAEELYRIGDPTDRDILAAVYLGQEEWNRFRDRASRIAPALFFQPHFPSIFYTLRLGDERERGTGYSTEQGTGYSTGQGTGYNTEQGAGDGTEQGYGFPAELVSSQAEEIRGSPLLLGFPYVKTFSPLRRFTTSFGGAMRFARGLGHEEGLRRGIHEPLPDAIAFRAMNRSFMADPDDRLFRDSVIVRLEDGKLHPQATFTRLAAFLDLPYTPSMSFCSERGVRDTNPTPDPEYAVGFSLASLNRDYSRYVNESEGAFLEYCLRDACRFYGYRFQYYDGGPMDEARLLALLDGFTTQDRLLREDWEDLSPYPFTLNVDGENVEVGPDTPEDERERLWAAHMGDIRRTRQAVGRAMLLPLRYVSRSGRPLRMIPLLEPDPALLDGTAQR